MHAGKATYVRALTYLRNMHSPVFPLSLSQLLVGASALFWATSGTGLRPMMSALDAAKHYEEEKMERHKRWPFGSKVPYSPSFIASRPDLSRQVSLPTIMSHGLATLDEPSDRASICSVPRSLCMDRHHAWPPIYTSSSLGKNEQSVIDRVHSVRNSLPCMWYSILFDM